MAYLRHEYSYEELYLITDPQLDILTNRLHKSTGIANKIVSTMEPHEIIERLNNVKLTDEFKTQLLLMFPKMHKIIDVTKLAADYRTILLCDTPTKAKIKKFDINANDMLIKHYRYLMQHGDKSFIRHLYQNINDEKLVLFKIEDWRSLLSYNVQMASRFDIKTIRNQSELRHFILYKPYILHYATLKDMQQCVIDVQTWIRIITKMTPKNREHVPAGFMDWARRDIFKKKLSGRKFKTFAADWMKGLKD